MFTFSRQSLQDLTCFLGFAWQTLCFMETKENPFFSVEEETNRESKEWEAKK